MRLICLLLPIFLLSAGCESGCFPSWLMGYNYSARAINTGKALIYVEQVPLFESDDFSELVVGLLGGGGSKESGQYRHAPDEFLTMKWKNRNNGEDVSVPVVVNPPKIFRNGILVFRINPETNTVNVSYIIKSDTGSDYEVDSDGNPVPSTPKTGKKSKAKSDVQQEN